VEKLKKRYKSFEQKRALLAEFDVFMVDDRIIKIVADFLGKTFYQSKAKRPIPIRLIAGAFIDKTKKDNKESQNVVGTAQGVAKEVETALSSTYLSMSPSANTSIRVGLLSMTPQQLAENTSVVVAAITSKHIEQGWRNVHSLHLKGPSTKAMPIWIADELWTDATQVLDQPHEVKSLPSGKTADRKRKWEDWEEEMLDDEEFAAKKAKRDAAKEKKAAKKSISNKRKAALKDSVMEDVQTPLIAG
jgi:ribosome biogenesis protein UTP30